MHEQERLLHEIVLGYLRNNCDDFSVDEVIPRKWTVHSEVYRPFFLKAYLHPPNIFFSDYLSFNLKRIINVKKNFNVANGRCYWRCQRRTSGFKLVDGGIPISY